MPFISDLLKVCVFYLYSSADAATSNSMGGGTGVFILGKTEAGHHVVYAITNHHVITKGKAPVIRVNSIENGSIGKPIPINLTKAEWIPHKGGADLCAAIVEIDEEKHAVMAIPVEWCITPGYLERHEVDVGDDVYMLGRFVYHAGKTFNMVSARSGMVSALPNAQELIPMESGPQEAFLVEMRSVSGTSGSPVFLHNEIAEFMSRLEHIGDKYFGLKPIIDLEPERDMPFMLLGIDAGSFPLYERLYQMDGPKFYEYEPDPPKMHSKDASGFAIVIPSWKIIELLNQDEFRRHRMAVDKEKSGHAEGTAVADVSTLDDREASPVFTQNAFENALKQASEKLSPPDQETKET